MLPRIKTWTATPPKRLDIVRYPARYCATLSIKQRTAVRWHHCCRARIHHHPQCLHYQNKSTGTWSIPHLTSKSLQDVDALRLFHLFILSYDVFSGVLRDHLRCEFHAHVVTNNERNGEFVPLENKMITLVGSTNCLLEDSAKSLGGKRMKTSVESTVS